MTSEDQLLPANFKFSGFLTPNYTQIPDQLFDELLPILSGNEIKILMYICRRTFGFKKDIDNISLAQMVSGITAKDGTKLDGGTGLSKASVARALKELEDKNIILRVRRSDPQRGDLPTTYQLNVIDPRKLLSRGEEGSHNSDTPRVSHRDTPLSHLDTPRVSHRDTQETVIQETENTTTYSKNGNEPQQRQSVPNAVVAALVSFGISQNVSELLAKQYSADYIREKIAFLEFLVKHERSRVKKPAAWLRSAIEDDYIAPDGFQTTAQRERQANEEKERKQATVEAQKAYSDRSEQRWKEQEAERSARLQKLHRQYQTNLADFTFWNKAKTALSAHGISDVLIAYMEILKFEANQVVIHVRNHFMCQQLEKPKIRSLIETALQEVASHPVALVFVVGDQAEEGSHEQ